jgi:chemotaxis protein methyltransferase CheR
LEQKILPELKAANPNLKIWSAGCSTGEEPYTLAIVASEQLWGTQSRILATDIDQAVLAKAKEGIYPGKAMVNVPPRLLDKYFERQGDNYIARDVLKKLINLAEAGSAA